MSPTTNRSPRTAAPDPTEAAARLRLAATRLARRLRKLADTGLTPSQLSALATIDRVGPLTLGALAEAEGVAPPTITRIVAHLEATGLVGRSVDPTDRRASRVELTASGRELLDSTRRRRTAWLAERIADLDRADFARLVAALDILESLGADDAGGVSRRRESGRAAGRSGEGARP